MEYELSKPSERIRDTTRLLEPLSREDALLVGKAGSYPIFRPGLWMDYLPLILIN